MDSPLKGEVAFEVDGARYRAVFGIEAMSSLETHFDCSMNALAPLLGRDIKSADLVEFLQAALLAYHPDVTEVAVRRMIGVLGIGATLAMLVIAWGHAFEIGAEAPKAVRPRRPAGSRRLAGTGSGS